MSLKVSFNLFKTSIIDRYNNGLLYIQEDIDYSISKIRKDEYINRQCTPEAKHFAKLILDNTTYVSFNDFTQNLHKAFNKFLLDIKNFEYILVLHTLKTKSNYWVAQLLMYYCIQNNLKKPLEIVEHIYVSEVEHKNNNLKYLMVDDASYSGNQMYDDIETELFQTKTRLIGRLKYETTPRLNFDNNKICILLSYVSNSALQKIKEQINVSNIYYGEIMLNLVEILKYKWEDKYTKMLSKHFRLFSYLPLKRVPVYFAHKLADNVSSYPEIYGTGYISKYNITSNHQTDYDVYDNECKKNKLKCSNNNISLSDATQNFKSDSYYPLIDICNEKCVSLAKIQQDKDGELLKNKQNELCIPAFYKLTKLDEPIILKHKLKNISVPEYINHIITLKNNKLPTQINKKMGQMVDNETGYRYNLYKANLDQIRSDNIKENIKYNKGFWQVQ